MYQGSCLFGAVTIEIHGDIKSIIHCHCSKCRKNSGTAYATNGFIAKNDLVIKQGTIKFIFMSLLQVKNVTFVVYVHPRFSVAMSKHRIISVCALAF